MSAGNRVDWVRFLNHDGQIDTNYVARGLLPGTYLYETASGDIVEVNGEVSRVLQRVIKRKIIAMIKEVADAAP